MGESLAIAVAMQVQIEARLAKVVAAWAKLRDKGGPW